MAHKNAKPVGEKNDDTLNIRCKKSDKDAWTEASGDLTTSAWITQALNEKVKNEKSNPA